MNLIFSSFHYNPSANKSHNVKLQTYLENIFVALVTAKNKNPETEVALIVTESTLPLLPETFVNSLKERKVNVFSMPFTYFKNDEGQIWSFSFYRLSIMLELSKTNKYENIISIDSDTVSILPIQDAIVDSKDFLLLYDINHNHSVQQSIDTFNDYKNLRNKEVYFTNYGGEFIGGSSKNLNLFMTECLKVFNDLNSKQIKFTHGDETVLAIAAYETNLKIKNAGVYVNRFWTGRSITQIFYTSNLVNEIAIIHVPDEKITGLHEIYLLLKKNKTLTITRIKKILGINFSRPIRIKEIWALIKRKLSK